MAETVGLHIESMLPELESMTRIGLFKPEEINDIVKKRKEFEYKTGRTMKEKEDFLRYINYEVKLLREVRLRRDKYRIIEKKSEIEYSICKRVVKLYQIALSYFQSDNKMWVSYINFCTQTKMGNVVSQAFQQMLQIHGDNKNLWSFAARWEVSEMNNIEGALNYLKTGLHHHPDSPQLFTQAFRLELKAVEKGDKTVMEKGVRRASVHFNAAVSAIGNDVDFVINLLSIATEYDFTENLQKEIIEYLTKNCWKSEQMWHTMAQRELNGHNYNINDMHKSTTQLCLAVYKSAIKILPTIAMWEKYLDTLIEIYHDEKRSKNIKFEILEKNFEQAYKDGFLLEKHYLVWLEKINDEEKYTDVLTRATKAIPNSIELWLIRLRHHSSQDDEQKFKAVAKEAIKSLGKDALQIYRTLIEYYQAKNGHNSFSLECKKIFEEGIAQPEPEISLPLRTQYIEWTSLTRSLKFARIEYEKLATAMPYSLALHKKMILLEMARFNPSVVNIRSIHKTACMQFGKDDSDVWIDTIKFEREYGDAMKIPEIYNTAKNNLKENLLQIFQSDYAILNSQ